MKLTEEEMHELEILTLLGEKDFDHNTCDNSYIDLVMKSGKKAFKIINEQQNEIIKLKEHKKNYTKKRKNYIKLYKLLEKHIEKKIKN